MHVIVCVHVLHYWAAVFILNNTGVPWDLNISDAFTSSSTCVRTLCHFFISYLFFIRNALFTHSECLKSTFCSDLSHYTNHLLGVLLSPLRLPDIYFKKNSVEEMLKEATISNLNVIVSNKQYISSQGHCSSSSSVLPGYCWINIINCKQQVWLRLTVWLSRLANKIALDAAHSMFYFF